MQIFLRRYDRYFIIIKKIILKKLLLFKVIQNFSDDLLSGSKIVLTRSNIFFICVFLMEIYTEMYYKIMTKIIIFCINTLSTQDYLCKVVL